VNRKYMNNDSTRKRRVQKTLGLHYGRFYLIARCIDSLFQRKILKNRSSAAPVEKVGLNCASVRITLPRKRASPRSSTANRDFFSQVNSRCARSKLSGYWKPMTKKFFDCGVPADISDFVAGTYEGSKNSIFPLGSLVGQGISLKITSANAFMRYSCVATTY